jgi:hypothetical protein
MRILEKTVPFKIEILTSFQQTKSVFPKVKKGEVHPRIDHDGPGGK